jgi:hypothetical protein
MFYQTLNAHESTNAAGFLTMPNASMNDMSTATALLWANEIFDNGSDFGASSGRDFVAPYTGKFLHGGTVRVDDPPVDGAWMRPQWHSANQTFTPNIYGQANLYGGNRPVYFHWSFSLMCLMDSSDVFSTYWYQSGGSSTANFHTESTWWGIGLM